MHRVTSIQVKDKRDTVDGCLRPGNRNSKARDTTREIGRPLGISLRGDRARNGRARQYAAFAPYSGTVRFLESAWWAREDSNLQPSGYERPNRAGKLSNNRYFCARSLTFVRVWLRRFIGYPLVGREAAPLHRHEGPALIERGIRDFGRTATLDGKIRISRRFRMQRLLDKMAN